MYVPETPQQTLFITRLIWGALLITQLSFAGVITMLISQRQVATTLPASTVQVFTYVPWVMLAVMIPLGYFVRMQSYKKNWQGNVITPRGYMFGNVVLFAACEGCAMSTLAFGMIQGQLWPQAVPALFALGVLVLNFPDGKAMFAPNTPSNVTTL